MTFTTFVRIESNII